MTRYIVVYRWHGQRREYSEGFAPNGFARRDTAEAQLALLQRDGAREAWIEEREEEEHVPAVRP